MSRAVLMLSSALATLLIATPASAQQQTSADPAALNNDSSAANPPPEIVVTAQKRTQLLIDVPQSITVVSGAALENQQATSFQDYLKLVPGLQLDQSNPGQGRLILRGINTGGVASSVSVYVDETPFGSSSGLVNGGVLAGDFDTFDVSRVEVLRGPQGTLYGASSLGGLLKFVTNAPDTKKVVARGRVSIEDTDGGEMSYRAHGVLNVPLSDSLALRASGTYRKDGGFIDSIGTRGSDPLGFGIVSISDIAKDINSAKSYGGRASLLFKPAGPFDLRLSAVMQNIRTKAPSYVESDPNTLKTLYGRPTQSQFIPTFGNVDYRVYNGLMNYDLGFATITSSTSYSTQRQTFRDDATFNLSFLLQAITTTPNELYLGQKTNSKKFTQEVRLASKDNETFEWLVGGFYTNEKGLIFQEFVTVAPGTLNRIDTGLGLLLAEVSIKSRYREYAGFANGTIHLGKRLHVDIGGRYSHNSQRAAQTAQGPLAGNVVIDTDLNSSDNVFTYSIAPRFELNDHASLYARVAKGYRPGGPNATPPNAPVGTPQSFSPDTTTSYEVGFKAETADRRATLDVAAYHIDWSNIQLLTQVSNFGININGGDAKVDGVEFTATYRPVTGLNLSLNGAYTDARLAEDTPLLVGGRKGDRLPFTPKLAIGLNADYVWSLGGETTAFFGGSLRALSKQTGDYDLAFRTANGRQRRVPSYEVVDLRAGVDFGRFSVEAFTKNLFNSDGKTSTISPTASGFPQFPGGAIGTGVIRPRSIGLSLTAGL